MDVFDNYARYSTLHASARKDRTLQTLRDTDTRGYRKPGDQTHSGGTLYPVGYSLDRDHSSGFGRTVDWAKGLPASYCVSVNA